MNARTAFNQLLMQLASTLEAEQYVADGGAFRRRNAEGDWLLIEFQESDISSESETNFYINIALVLGPRWEWDKQRLGRPATSTPRSSAGIWRRRLAQERLGGTHRWSINDTGSVGGVFAEVISYLNDELPMLTRLLNREELLHIALDENYLGQAAWQVAAWLVAGKGQTDRLSRLLAEHGPGPNSPIHQAIMQYADSVRT